MEWSGKTWKLPEKIVVQLLTYLTDNAIIKAYRRAPVAIFTGFRNKSKNMLTRDRRYDILSKLPLRQMVNNFKGI